MLKKIKAAFTQCFVVCLAVTVTLFFKTVDGCSSTTRLSTSPTGAIQHIRSYSFMSPNEDSCWLVSSIAAAIQFKLIKFDVPDNNDCESAWLTIYDGMTIRDKIVTVLCRERNPGTIFFTGRYGLVRYQTGPQFKTGSFLLQFTPASKHYLSKQYLHSNKCSSASKKTASIACTSISLFLLLYIGR